MSSTSGNEGAAEHTQMVSHYSHFSVISMFVFCCFLFVVWSVSMILNMEKLYEVMPDGHVSIQIAASRNMRKLFLGHFCLASDFLTFRKTYKNVC